VVVDQHSLDRRWIRDEEKEGAGRWPQRNDAAETIAEIPDAPKRIPAELERPAENGERARSSPLAAFDRDRHVELLSTPSES
jgi:hypothetical protein